MSAAESSPADGDVVVALVQLAPVVSQPDHNLRVALTAVERASDSGADLVVFPECALTGYVLDQDEAARLAEPVPGPATEALSEAARRADVTIVIGMLVRDGDELYNSAVLVNADGEVRQYRKAHLPQLGLDNFCQPGNSDFIPFETPVGRLGLLICYDLRFPEAARALALNGADMLVAIANWPHLATDYPEVVTRARAGENRLPLVVASRVGEERGVTYLGRSQAVLPDGTVLAEAGSSAETLTVRFSAVLIRASRGLPTRAERHGGLLADRRPDLYGVLTAAGTTPVPLRIGSEAR